MDKDETDMWTSNYRATKRLDRELQTESSTCCVVVVSDCLEGERRLICHAVSLISHPMCASKQSVLCHPCSQVPFQSSFDLA